MRRSPLQSGVRPTLLWPLLSALLPMILLGGCATPGPGGAPARAPAVTPQTAGCRALFDRQDAEIAAAGVADAGAARVPGFRYLRANRFLASFAAQDLDADAARTWIERLRQRDLASRRAELRQLGDADAAASRLADADHCGKILARLELAAPAQRAELRSRVRVDDSYAPLARVFGFYPLAVPFLRAGIAGYHEDVEADYARPLAALDSPGPLQLWVPATAAAASSAGESGIPPPLADLPRDALGVPQINAAQWSALARRYAPQWWIENGGPADLPGAPTRDDRGRPGVDPAQPVVYVHHGFTRLGRRVLPELVYVVWFDRRPPTRRIDPYAGALDGVMWRVVPGPDGRPLHYDSIHPCGCYRYSYATGALQRRDADDGYWQEPALWPQDRLPPQPLALRVQSGTHYLRRVVAADPPAAVRHAYQLRPYDDLLALPDGKGGRRSLFGSDGIVAGSQRSERWWLWVTGVPDPGAMREWGTQATAFVGRRHYDDARFLEQLYVVPEWAR